MGSVSPTIALSPDYSSAPDLQWLRYVRISRPGAPAARDLMSSLRRRTQDTSGATETHPGLVTINSQPGHTPVAHGQIDQWVDVIEAWEA